jgi:fission 1 protein
VIYRWYLIDLLDEGHDPKECLYWIALTFYGLGEYRLSRKYCERLIKVDPSHSKALVLHDCIKDMVVKGITKLHIF